MVAALNGVVSATTLAYVVSAMNLVPAMIRAGLEIKELAEQVIAVVKKDGGPTDEDLQALADRRAAIRAQLEAAGQTEPDVPVL